MAKRIGTLVVVGFVVLAATSCSDDEGADTIAVTADEFSYAPSEWTVGAGDFDVEFTNDGGTKHEFVILSEPIETEDEYTSDLALDEVEAESGETITKTFTLDEPGTYQVFCAIGGHCNSGMSGTLTVE